MRRPLAPGWARETAPTPFLCTKEQKKTSIIAESGVFAGRNEDFFMYNNSSDNEMRDRLLKNGLSDEDIEFIMSNIRSSKRDEN